MRVRLVYVLALCLSLTGCSNSFFDRLAQAPMSITGVPITGTVRNGMLPVYGARVYLLAAGSSAYGGASLSLLQPGSTGTQDSTGAYVTTAVDGSFTIPGYYSCGSTTLMYLYASGGNSGLGENTAASQIGAIGACPDLGTNLRPVIINETTTVAAAFALAGFATDGLHIASNNSLLSLLGLKIAFANASHLASLDTGTAMASLPGGSATAPQATINTLANILSGCLHSVGAGSSPCQTLLTSGKTGSIPVSDSVSALLAIAHAPAANVASLYVLQTPSSPFQPALSAPPDDFSLSFVFKGGGLASINGMAIDGTGNAWIVNAFGGVTKISSDGYFLSGANGFDAGLNGAGSIAFDSQGNAWITNGTAVINSPGSVVKLSSDGQVLSGSSGFTAPGIGLRTPFGIAVDARDNVWVSNQISGSVTEFASTGQVLSGMTGYTGGGLSYPSTVAIDASGNVWIANETSNGITKLSANGTPLSGPSGFTASGFHGGTALAVDSQGSVWVSKPGVYAQLSKLSSAGSVVSGSGYVGGGIVSGGGGYMVALDGAGNVWIPLYSGKSVAEFSNSGDLLSGPVGYGAGIAQFPYAIAVDGSGDLWVSSTTKIRGAPNVDQVTELIGIAVPVVTPLVAGVRNNTIASRP